MALARGGRLTAGCRLPVFGAVIDKLRLLAPGAQVRTLDGAGHVPHGTHPEALVAALLAFHDQLGH